MKLQIGYQPVRNLLVALDRRVEEVLREHRRNPPFCVDEVDARLPVEAREIAVKHGGDVVGKDAPPRAFREDPERIDHKRSLKSGAMEGEEAAEEGREGLDEIACWCSSEEIVGTWMGWDRVRSIKLRLTSSITTAGQRAC